MFLGCFCNQTQLTKTLNYSKIKNNKLRFWGPFELILPSKNASHAVSIYGN